MTASRRPKKISGAIRRAKSPEVLEYSKELPHAFGIDNAKQLPVEQAVNYFVPPKEFLTLLVPKNHILLGSRGSGKTTWVRALAYDHVSLAASDSSSHGAYARDAIARHLIGIYVPASAAFTGDLRNKPWQTEQEAEEYFTWRLNIHSCAALTHIIDACIKQYASRDQLKPQLQYDICRTLSKAWTGGKQSFTSYEGLRLALSELELEHLAAIRRIRTSSIPVQIESDHFHTDLFLPLRHAIRAIRAHLKMPADAVWMLCLDEVEYLSEAHHRILNTQLRSASEDLVFKIATMPFAHHTLATNLNDSVREGHDFEYVYVDREPIDSHGGQGQDQFLAFARSIFSRRISHRNDSLKGVTLGTLLGASELLDEKRNAQKFDHEKYMELLRRHANPATVARAERLAGTHKFQSEIYRKLNGALLLREALHNATGNTSPRIYSGETLIVRCSDGNPRRLMRLINLLIQRLEFNSAGRPVLPIDQGAQNSVVESLGRETLTRTQSEPPYGEQTAKYLEVIGKYMNWAFLARRVGTDQTTSVEIYEDDGPVAQRFIKQAIQLSLMIPAKDVPIKTPNYTCTGIFHLSFLFAPLFGVLPRRNRSVRLSRVLNHKIDGPSKFSDIVQTSFLEQE